MRTRRAEQNTPNLGYCAAGFSADALALMESCRQRENRR